MEKIKLANDAASITACALEDYINGELNWEPFTKALYYNFPKEIAEHVEKIVSKVVHDQKAKEAGMLPG